MDDLGAVGMGQEYVPFMKWCLLFWAWTWVTAFSMYAIGSGLIIIGTTIWKGLT